MLSQVARREESEGVIGCFPQNSDSNRLEALQAPPTLPLVIDSLSARSERFNSPTAGLCSTHQVHFQAILSELHG